MIMYPAASMNLLMGAIPGIPTGGRCGCAPPERPGNTSLSSKALAFPPVLW